MTVIVTKRLRLTEYDPAPSYRSLITMVKWLNDPDVVKYSEQRHKQHTIQTQGLYIADGPRNFREIHTANAFIGTITAHVDKNNSVANVGILIGEKTEWGKGYGTEAWQTFCDFLLTAGGIRKIEAGAMSCNHGMVKIFNKTEMLLEGIRIKHFQFNDEFVDLEHWARFA